VFRRNQPQTPVPGLAPAIHVFVHFDTAPGKAWMAGTSPAKERI